MSPHELSRPFDGYQIRQPASDVQGIKHNDIPLVSEGSFDNCASTCHRIKNRARCAAALPRGKISSYQSYQVRHAEDTAPGAFGPTSYDLEFS
jgi:hypothetical protein